jgi:hypothetical protein
MQLLESLMNYFLNLPKKPINTPNPALSNDPLSVVEGDVILNKLKVLKIIMNMSARVNIDSKIDCPIFDLMWSFLSILSSEIVCPP